MASKRLGTFSKYFPSLFFSSALPGLVRIVKQRAFGCVFCEPRCKTSYRGVKE